MATLSALVTERRVRVMGTDAHLLAVGPDPTIVDALVELLNALEQRWSRFIPTSDVSRLNRAAGAAVQVDESTLTLIERAIVAHRLTGGRFDPTALNAVEANGYDRSFDEMPPDVDLPTRPSVPTLGAGGIVTDRATGTVQMPIGVGFDPGAIGKGLAADLVVARGALLGCSGIMVNVGGDLRATGQAPRGSTWCVAVHEPQATDDPLGIVTLDEGAVATSTPLRRHWRSASGPRHHLINPATGCPWVNAARQVTVVAAEGWWAEASATALIGPDAPLPPDCAAIVVDHDGTVRRLGAIDRYLR